MPVRKPGRGRPRIYCTTICSRKESRRNWIKRNPDAVKALKKAHCIRHKNAINEYHRRWRAKPENAAKRRAWAKRYWERIQFEAKKWREHEEAGKP